MTSPLIWLIFLLPVLSFLIISLLIRPLASKESRLAGYLAIIAIGSSFILSLVTLSSVMSTTGHELALPDINWLTIGNLNVRIGLMVDSLTAVMLVVVTLVSLMVQIYSLGYMKDNWDHSSPAYHRYYAWMCLFTASMLGVVLANSLLMIFVFWEMVGLCSYLLIGFWCHRPSAANAAKKAFIVTRFGDFGFLAAILLIFTKTHTFNIAELYGIAGTAAIQTGSSPLREQQFQDARHRMITTQLKAVISAKAEDPDPRLAGGSAGVNALCVCDAARRASERGSRETVVYS